MVLQIKRVHRFLCWIAFSLAKSKNRRLFKQHFFQWLLAVMLESDLQSIDINLINILFWLKLSCFFNPICRLNLANSHFLSRHGTRGKQSTIFLLVGVLLIFFINGLSFSFPKKLIHIKGEKLPLTKEVARSLPVFILLGNLNNTAHWFFFSLYSFRFCWWQWSLHIMATGKETRWLNSQVIFCWTCHHIRSEKFVIGD